jgi:hypothetical protein
MAAWDKRRRESQSAVAGLLIWCRNNDPTFTEGEEIGDGSGD